MILNDRRASLIQGDSVDTFQFMLKVTLIVSMLHKSVRAQLVMQDCLQMSKRSKNPSHILITS